MYLLGDVIQYYVAAQDVFGYVSTVPIGGSGINPPGTTPPGSPNSYTIIGAPLAGDYTVGSAFFNNVSGKNITFETVVKKVTKEVLAETTVPVYDKNSNVVPDASSLLYNSEGAKVMQGGGRNFSCSYGEWKGLYRTSLCKEIRET